jgi:hypothetical protein
MTTATTKLNTALITMTSRGTGQNIAAPLA